MPQPQRPPEGASGSRLIRDTPRFTRADGNATIGAVPDEWSVDPNNRGETSNRPAADLDRALFRLAERQHGVVARRQLLELGIGSRTIEYRVERARLHPVHRGVYAVGHRNLSTRGRWMAALLAHGPGAILSHRSAGSLWGLLRSARTIIETSDDELVAGDVVTVEPGVYVPGRFGVRIEDLVSVEDAGCRNLSGRPKELQVVG